jgi:hypothetical protein
MSYIQIPEFSDCVCLFVAKVLLEFIEYAAHRGLHTRTVSRYTTSHTSHHHHQVDRSHNYASAAFALAVMQQVTSVAACGASLWFEYSMWCTYATWSVLVYNTAHFASHTNWVPLMRDYHRAHHRNSSTNVGVSSPLVDWVCGTMNSKFIVRAPIMLLLPSPLSFFAVSVRH